MKREWDRIRTRAASVVLAMLIVLPSGVRAEANATGAQCDAPPLRLASTALDSRPGLGDAPAVGSAPPASAQRERARALRAAVERLGEFVPAARIGSILHEAEELLSSLDESMARPDLLLHIARSLARLSRASDSAEANRARLRAVTLYDRVSSQPGASPRERSWALGERARVYLDAGRAEESLALSRRALAIATREGDLLAEYRFGRVLALALDASGDRTGATEMMRRTARIGEGLRRERLGRSSTGDDGGFKIDSHATTGQLLSMLLDEVEVLDAVDHQDRLREVRDLLETQRSAELEDHFRDACLAEDPDLEIDQIPGALVLYPIVLEDRVALLTGFEGHFTYSRAPIMKEALLDHARSLRRLLEKRTTRQYLRPAGHLYDAMIRPIEAQLEDPEVDTLVVVPDGLLRTVPFAAFHDRSGGRFAIDIKPIALVPSLRLTRPTPLARESISVLAAGIESATRGFARLDYTRQELENLKARFPRTRVLFDEHFEIDALERELAERPYSIVHVATHGRVAADGSDSFLLAHDGTLGLDRMSELIATTRFRRDDPLELLTLSACETAAGDSEAALGLAGVALRSGARSALATLWPVNDEATTELIDVFYEELARPNQTRASALRKAQRRMRQTPRFEHPGYWAPFLMISSWL